MERPPLSLEDFPRYLLGASVQEDTFSQWSWASLVFASTLNALLVAAFLVLWAKIEDGP